MAFPGDSSQGLRWFLGVSAAAHLATVYALPALGSASSVPSEPEFIEISMAALEEPSSEPPPPEEEPPEESEPEIAAVAPTPHPASIEREVEPTEAEPPIEEIAGASGDVDAEEAGEAGAPEEQGISVPGGLEVDPRAVALSALAAQGPRRARPQEQPPTDEESAAEQSARLSRQHGSFLAHEANRRDYVTRRGPPDIRRQRDGSYTYHGTGVTARILPNGEVRFQDRSSVRFATGGPEDSVGASMGFDITDAMERRQGNDPYSAERRWFMEETEELRERLMVEYRREQEERDERGLRGRLRGIWENQRRSAEERRAQIFRLWDGMSQDETGDAGRRAVILFVRTRLPRGSEEAYTTGELAALNGTRRSEARFSPY